MARTKTKGPSKSQAIRDFMRKNKGATVQQIVDGLKSEGVKAALVYNVQSDIRKKKGVKGSIKKAAAASSNGSAAGTSKADSIRHVAQGLPKPIRPRDVVAALNEQGISVSPAQVSQVLKSMGLKRRRRGQRPAAMAGRAATPMGEMLTLENLLAAKKLVNQLGSVEAAKQAVDALVKLS